MHEINVLVVDDRERVKEDIIAYFKDNLILTQKKIKINVLNQEIGYIKGMYDLMQYLKDNPPPDYILLDLLFNEGKGYNPDNLYSTGFEILEVIMKKKRSSYKQEIEKIPINENYRDTEVIILSNNLVNKGTHNLKMAFMKGAVAVFTKAVIEKTNDPQLVNAILTIERQQRTQSVIPIIGHSITRNFNGFTTKILPLFSNFREYVLNKLDDEPIYNDIPTLTMRNIVSSINEKSPSFRQKQILLGICQGKSINEIQDEFKDRGKGWNNFNNDKQALFDAIRQFHPSEIGNSDYHILLYYAIQWRLNEVKEYLGKNHVVI